MISYVRETNYVYPFFIECSKYEYGQRRQQLQRLAFGRGGLIVRKKLSNVLVVDGGEFEIPNTFSESARQCLKNILWPENTDFFVLQKTILEAKRNWINAKKKEKLRLIDLYVIENNKSFNGVTVNIMRAIISMALILKLITHKDIEYNNYEIESINYDFNEKSFDDIKP